MTHVVKIARNFGPYNAWTCACGELFMSMGGEGICPLDETNVHPVFGCLRVDHATCAEYDGNVSREVRERAIACLAKACLCQLHDDCRANTELSLTCRKEQRL